MNSKIKNFIKNVIRMFVANGLSFLISAIITFIVPKILNVENYSYIQLYIFYTSYISYLHYGWVDGIRLRYGGIYYEKIDKSLFNSQILMYSVLQILVSLIALIVIINIGFTGNKLIAMIAVTFCMLTRLPRIMPQYILEMSNRIKECANITIIEKVTYFLLTIAVIITKHASIVSLLACDLVAQVISGLYAFICCKDILKAKPVALNTALIEVKENVSAGIKLTIANISSLLIIGIVRQFIEFQWDISTFGKLSLTISISNLLMVFIRAIAMVMFPTLRRISKEKLTDIYVKMRTAIMVPLLLMLVFYYPLKVVISSWLPQYSDSLKYMAILFPMCIFESKMSMLIETYLKTLRLENLLLKINIATVLFSLIITFINTCVLHNLNLSVLSIVILLAFRSIVAEKVLSHKIDIKVNFNIFLELFLVIVFILSSWFIGGIRGVLTYSIFFIVYILLIRKDISSLINYFLKGWKKNEKN